MISTQIAINDDSWLKEIKNLESFLQKTVNIIAGQTKLEELIENNTEIELSILLTNDQEIKELNKNYRHKDKSTNILSFPCFNKESDLTKLAIDNFLAIGDIVFSLQTIKKEAFEQSKTFKNHLTHLLIHGILHLLGYDHEKEEEAIRMEGLEIDILKKLAIDNPYAII